MTSAQWHSGKDAHAASIAEFWQRASAKPMIVPRFKPGGDYGSVAVRQVATGAVFPSIKDAAIATGLGQKSIARAVHGKPNCAGEWIKIG